MLRQSLLRLVASLAVSALALVALATPASAHNALRSTDPADGATVATVPEAVTLTFDGEVLALGSVVEVANPAGDVVSAGEPEVDDNTVTQALTGDLVPGEYTVTWRVTSGDGHPIDGTFGFTATAASALPGDAVSPAPSDQPTAEATPSASTEPSDDATPAATSDGSAVTSAEDPAEPTGEREPQTVLATLGILVALGALIALTIGKQRQFAARTREVRHSEEVAATSGDDAPPAAPDEDTRA